MEFGAGKLEFFFSTLVFYEDRSGDVIYAYFLGEDNPNGVDVSLGAIYRERRKIVMDVTTMEGLTEFLVYIIDHESIHWALRQDHVHLEVYEDEEAMVDWAMRTFFIRPLVG